MFFVGRNGEREYLLAGHVAEAARALDFGRLTSRGQASLAGGRSFKSESNQAIALPYCILNIVGYQVCEE
jgi:hypothetical protein